MQECRDVHCLLSSECQLTMMRKLPKMVFNLHRELHEYRVVSNTCTWLWHPMQAVIPPCVCTRVLMARLFKIWLSGAASCLMCAPKGADCSWHIRLPTREPLGAIGWGKDDLVQCLATAKKCVVFSAWFLLEQTLQAVPRLCPFARWCPGTGGVLCWCARRGVFGPAVCAGNRFVEAGTPPSAQRPGAFSLV